MSLAARFAMNRVPAVWAWRRVPLGLLGMLALVVCVERQLTRHPMELSENSPTSWSYSHTQARRSARDAEILCFGSSLVKFGVLPAMLEEETGRKSFNLAVYGGRMASSYYLLKRALDAGARPLAVLVDCHDGPVPVAKRNELNEAVESNRRNWPEILGEREIADLSWNVGSPNFFAAATLSEWLPSVKCRHEIRSLVVSAIEAKVSNTFGNNLTLLRNWNANKGGQVMPAAETVKATSVAEPLAGPASDLPPVQYLPNPFMDLYVEKFLDLAKRRNITVFWVIAPMSPPVLLSQHTSGYEKFATESANEIQRRYANVIVIDGRQSGYSTDAFLDATHLNMKGNVCFSHDLGVAIARRLSGRDRGSRWKFLPRFRPVTPVHSPEDFQQSWMALRTGAVGRF